VADRHLSIRVSAATFERLDRECRRTGQSRSELARTLLEEGLRMAAHPGIVFRGGPVGRRPALADGPDIWEVARVFTGVDTSGNELVETVCELTGLNIRQVRSALRYYAEYRDEIDEWIRLVDEEADRAEAAWEREQVLLQT
jgi:hypothetical protein